MKRSCLPCWPDSLAAKHQCLIKTVAAVKVAIALCQAEITQYEEQHEAENQSVIPKRNMKRSCRHCDGRQFVLTEGTTSPATEIPTPVHDMQYTGHHDDVSQLWSVIRSTKKLREGSVVDSAVCGQWMRFPTSNMRPHRIYCIYVARLLTSSIIIRGSSIQQTMALSSFITWCHSFTLSQATHRHQDRLES